MLVKNKLFISEQPRVDRWLTCANGNGMNQQHHLICSTVSGWAAVSRETGHAPSFSSLQPCPQHDWFPLSANRVVGLAEEPMPSQHWMYFHLSLVSTHASHCKLICSSSAGLLLRCFCAMATHPSPGEGGWRCEGLASGLCSAWWWLGHQLCTASAITPACHLGLAVP